MERENLLGGGKEGSYNNRDKSAVVKSKSFYTPCDADAAAAAAPANPRSRAHLGGLASGEIEIQICGAAVGESIIRRCEEGREVVSS